MTPDAIIVDIREPMIEFKAKLEDLEIQGELNVETIVKDMIPYLQDEQLAKGCLQEYTRDLADVIRHQVRPETLTEFTNAVNELGAEIIYQLQEMVAYNDHGALWYEFHDFCGNDIVLIRSTLSAPLPRKSP